MNFSSLAEVDASEFFMADDSHEWDWCFSNATFAHKEACEFVVHIGDPSEILKGNDTLFEHNIESMKKYGCSQKFIDLYREAKEAGATRVLFYA